MSRESVTDAKLSHKASDKWVEENVVAPTCTEGGSYDSVLRCSVCGEELDRKTVETDALGHKAGTTVIENSTAASCGGAGSYDEVVYCTVCGEELSRTTHTVDAIPHSYKETITEEATCEEAGLKTFTCSVCGDTYTEAIDALGHDKISHEAKAPTCTAIGWDAYETCSRCDYTTYNELAATGHSYDEEVTAPTCNDKGYTTYTCSACGTSYTSNETPALGHDMVVDEAVSPDCTNTGLTEGAHCTRCDYKVAQEEVPALGHKEETIPATSPDCTNTGLTEGTKCSVCGEILVAQEEVPALGHKEETIPAVSPDCTNTGLTEGTKCSVCGEILVAQEEVPALGHKEETIPAVSPDCTNTGLTEGTKCSVCGEILVAQEEVPALGHKEETIPAVAPDCTNTGLTEGTKCSVCGEILKAQEVVPALGHTDKDDNNICDVEDCKEILCGENDHVENDGEVTTPATCVATGVRTYSCSACGKELRTEEIPVDPNAHNIVEMPAKPMTCTEDGHSVYDACTLCDYEDGKNIIKSPGHFFKTDVAAKAATCTEDGYTATERCMVCDYTKGNEVIPALGHDLTDVEGKAATCTEDGYTAHKACSRCDYIEGKEIIPAGHTYAEEWTTSETHHWHECTACGDDGSYEAHDEYNRDCKCGVTNEYRVVNGNFENGLDGWTFNNTFGDAPFAGIDEKSTFWGEGYAMFNVGKYFSSYADGAAEGSHGNLASSYFTVGSHWATYSLGGAGNHHTYITIENEAGEVLALYRNTRFTDFPAGDYSLEDRRAMIGNTVFLANFVSYKVDLSAFEGQKVRFVIHDYASAGWGVVYFDQLSTYHTEEPDGLLAENLLANKEALLAEIMLEVAEQGDYTLDSFEAYTARLTEAKALINDIAVNQETVDSVTANLTDARLALTVRPVVEVEGAIKSFNVMSEKSLEIVLGDYVNTNGLNNITYAISAENGLVTLGEIADGRFTITAGKVNATSIETVTITVLYNGEAKLAVNLTLNITADLTPVVMNDEISMSVDAFGRESITLELSENIDNVGNIPLTYSVNGTPIDGSSYVFTLGSYTDTVVNEILTVTVSYTLDNEEKSVSYTYNLGLYDSTVNRLANGGFENDLEGWSKVGNIGDVSTETSYWNGEFGMDGAKMFSAYAEGATEGAVGILTSSSFKVGGTGFVTFKLGAARDGNYVYVDVVDAETKQILARYYNGLWKDNETHCTLVPYKADLSAFLGREVFFRISDNADSGYGLFFADSFETYYEAEPEGFNEATAVDYTVSGTIYDLFNGGFEMGNVQGWWSIGEIGLVTNATGYWGDNIPYGKTGEYLFTGVESFGADTMREGNKGTLTSSAFELSGTGYVSFKLGGGGNALCYVQIIDAVTGEIIARYHQQAQQDAVLIQYVADLTAYVGRTLRIQVVDQATGGWGCVSFDDVVTYYPEGKALPEGHTANDIKYTLTNGSFENGLDGWTMNITEAGAHNTLGWVESSEHDAGWYTKNDGRKDGNNLFTFCRPDGTNCENTKGNLQSASFVLKKDSYVSFRFGGAGTRDVHLQLVRADGTVIATFYNEAPGKANTEMFAYYYQYTGEETECFFRVVDNSVSNYGCFVVDDFRANLESAPEGFIAAIQ